MSALPNHFAPSPIAAAINPDQAFQGAIAAAGMTPPDTIIADGKIHRFATNDRRGDDAGWYILHLDGIAAGSFGNWREGRTETWCSIERNAQSPEQQKHYATLLRSMQNARHRAKKAEHDTAADKAAVICAAATRIDDAAAHGYLVTKGIQAHGATLIDTAAARGLAGNLSHTLTGPLLVIPMRNAAGELRSLQFITEDGTKRPLTGGEKQGCHYLLGQFDAAAHGAILIVCEGFATGASIQEATGQPVAVAFDRGNLEPVAKSLRKAYPDAALIVAADDDHMTDGNPGRTDASGAAKAVGGVVVIPMFPAGRPDKATDFNDLHQIGAAQGGGLAAVQACFAGAINSIAVCASDTGAGGQNDAETHCVEVYSGGGNLATTTDTTEGGADAPLQPSPFPALDERPRYVVLDDWTVSSEGKHRPGVYYCGLTAGKKDAPPEPFDAWISSPMHIDAVTFDGQSNVSAPPTPENQRSVLVTKSVTRRFQGSSASTASTVLAAGKSRSTRRSQV